MATLSQLECFAVCLPGLEEIVARELVELGIVVDRSERGGCVCHLSPDQLPIALLGSGCTSHWLVRIAAFHARSFSELERRLAKVQIEEWIRPRSPWRIEVTAKRSRLYHTAAIAERIRRAFEPRIGSVAMDADAQQQTAPRGGGATKQPPQHMTIAPSSEAPPLTLQVRFDRDDCVLSLDAAGGGHHRRGHHLASVAAPLREDLARATLRASGWSGVTPLIDPMCGSGTIVIEAALLARRRAPGLMRSFSWQHSTRFDAASWSRARAAAVSAEQAPPTARRMIWASDRDAAAISATRSNAVHAGVADDISLQVAPLDRAPWPDGELALCVTNPPWGIRLRGGDLRSNVYGPLAARIAAHPGQRLVIVTPDARVRTCLGVAMEPILAAPHGGVDVKVWSRNAMRGPQRHARASSK